MNWIKAEGGHLPSEIDDTTSNVYVIIRRNIEQTENGYSWEEMRIPKDYYPIYIQQRGDIDFLAAMTEVDLDE